MQNQAKARSGAFLVSGQGLPGRQSNGITIGNKIWTCEMNSGQNNSSTQRRAGHHVIYGHDISEAKENQSKTTVRFSNFSEGGRDTVGPQGTLLRGQPLYYPTDNTKNPGTVIPRPLLVHLSDDCDVNKGVPTRADEIRTDSGGRVSGSLSPGKDTLSNRPGNISQPSSGHGSPETVTNPAISTTTDWKDLQAKTDSGAGEHTTTREPSAPLQSVSQKKFYPVFDHDAILEHSERIKTFWPDPSDHAKALFPAFCELYNKIKSFNRPNAIGARITLDSGLNLQEWESRLSHYHDNEICAY